MSDRQLPWLGPQRTEAPVPEADETASDQARGAGPFEAQLLTQGTVKRGLRGGQEVLTAARTTYLKTEWSGPRDRRPRAGLLTKTKV
jgi:hypothetical protein